MVKGSQSALKKVPATHPPYMQMITDALMALKERTGSSVPAMAKYLEQKYGKFLPENFRKILTVQLKRLVKSERLVKVKHSFKLVATAKAKKVDTKGKAVAPATRKKEKGENKKDKGKSIKKTKEKENVKKGKSAKVNETRKVVKKAIKTKRLSLVKTLDGMKKKNIKGGDKVAAGGAKVKVGKSTNDAPGKSVVRTKK